MSSSSAPSQPHLALLSSYRSPSHIHPLLLLPTLSSSSVPTKVPTQPYLALLSPYHSPSHIHLLLLPPTLLFLAPLPSIPSPPKSYSRRFHPIHLPPRPPSAGSHPSPTWRCFPHKTSLIRRTPSARISPVLSPGPW